MSRFGSPNEILFLISIVCYIVLLGRLRLSGLYHTYRIFFTYVAFQFLRSSVMYFLPRRTKLYGDAYFSTEVVVWLLYVLVVFELHRLVVEKYQGISTAARRLISGGIAVAVVASLVTLAADVTAAPMKYPILRYFMVAERGVVSVIVFFLLLLGAFMAWFPIVLPRNVIVHTMLFVVYFLSKNMSLFVGNLLGPAVRKTAGTSFQAVACACLIAWVVLLTPAGEKALRPLMHRWRREDEIRLLRQLESLNATLSGQMRK